MNSSISSLFGGRVATVISFAVCVVCTCSLAEFIEGDEVETTSEADLLFYDKPFRKAAAGETLKVLAYRPDLRIVYVDGRDAQGKQIGLGISQHRVKLKALSPEEAVKKSTELARAGNLTEAERVVSLASRAEPSNPEVAQAKIKIASIRQAQVALARAQQALVEAQAKAAQLRKGAAVAGRPNALNPSDTSNYDRAEKMRRQADEMEAAAKQGVANAEANSNMALETLAQSGTGHTALPMDNDTKLAISGETVLPLLPNGEGQKAWEKQEGERKEAAERKAQALAQYTDDEAIVPPFIPANKAELYLEALEGVNNRVSERVRAGKDRPVLKFGKNTGKFIVEFHDIVCLFDTHDLTPAVITTSGRYHAVAIQCRNGRKLVQLVDGSGEPKVTESLRFLVANEIDMKKVADAMSALILMGGGTREAFDGSKLQSP